MATPEPHANGTTDPPPLPQEGHYYHVLEGPLPSYQPPPPPLPRRTGSQTSLTSSSSAGSGDSSQLHQTTHPSPPTPPRPKKVAYKPTPGNSMSLPPKKSKGAPSRVVIPESLAQLHGLNQRRTGDVPPSSPPLPPTRHPRTFSLDEHPEPPKVPDSPRLRSQTTIAKIVERQVTGGMSLSQLARSYGKSCPFQIQILKGFCGQTARLTLSSQDTFNVHFLKRTKVVVVRDVHGTPYSIPLNSAVEFGLVYDPDDDRSKALDGYRFERVADILGLAEQPKVICAKKAIRGESEKTTFYDNEALIIKRTTQRSLFKGKRSLKVYSLSMKLDKTLPEDYIGYFSTTPYLCRMHLPELIEHVPDLFPATAVLYLNTDVYLKPHADDTVQGLPDTILQKVLTVEKYITETTLVASSVLREDPNPRYRDYGSDTDREDLFDIPVDEVALSEVEVAVVHPESTEDTEKLVDDTRTIFERFDPTKVIVCKQAGSQNSYNAQSLFYTAVREGCESFGIELEQPSIYDHVRSNFMQLPVPSTEPVPVASSAPKTETSVPRPVTEEAPRSDKSPRKLDRKKSGASPQPPLPPSPLAKTKQRAGPSELEDSDEYDIIRDEVFAAPVQSKVRGPLHDLDRRVSDLESEAKESNKGRELMQEVSRVKRGLTGIVNEVSSLKEQLQLLSAAVRKLEEQGQHPAPPSGAEGGRQTSGNTSRGGAGEHGGNAPSVEDCNMAFLVSMNLIQVENLLEAMSLSQYTETFSREQITGEILAELTDQDLCNDLGIQSRVHRLRLMRVISGRHSAENILTGVDPYGGQ